MTCLRVDEDGFGVGTIAETEVRVANFLPKEQGVVLIEHKSPHRKVAWGRLLETTGTPSVHRKAPYCQAFGKCGGCQWQHMTQDYAFLVKRQHLARHIDYPVDAMAAFPSPSDLEYRNKATYVLHHSLGSWKAGAYQPRSHKFVSTMQCKTVDPVIGYVMTELTRQLDAMGIRDVSPFGLRYAVVRVGTDGMLVAGLVGESMEGPYQLARELVDKCEALDGVVWSCNVTEGGRIWGNTTTPLVGKTTTLHTVLGLDFTVPIHGFWQANPLVHNAMCEFVISEIQACAPTAVIDMYCGAGVYALGIAKLGIPCLGMESHDGNIAIATKLATDNNYPARFIVRDLATGILEKDIQNELLVADAVVVNPPRKGLSPAVASWLCENICKTIVYVSCCPQSLGRDLEQLTSVYSLHRVQCFDMMPGTSSLETVCVLRPKLPL